MRRPSNNMHPDQIVEKPFGASSATPMIGIATPKTGSATPSTSTKSPSRQSYSLSDADRARLKTWLSETDKPFGVTTVPLSKKRKRDTFLQVQDDLWEERLSVQYEVKPRDKWEALRKYKKFTVGSESIATGECVLIKHDEGEHSSIDIADQWKAKVLEVRALDPEHVYLRVAWLNRPEDLDSGRKAYHGKHELIPTNDMDVIDAMTVNGTLEVLAWNDAEDESALVEEDQYFWRQTYDSANSKTYSKLRQICIDNKPQNPDEMILQCPNEGCHRWLHLKCIAEAAVQQAFDEARSKNGVNSSTKRKSRPSNDLTISADSPAVAKAAKSTLTAEVFLKGLPLDAPEHKRASATEITFTDSNDGNMYAERLCCLHCEKIIDE